MSAYKIPLNKICCCNLTLRILVHCGSIRQTASILSMSRECLRTGDKAAVHFRFIKNPEYLHVGTRMVFREGRTKAIGNIAKLLTGVPPNIVNKSKVKKILRQSATTSSGSSATASNNPTTANSNNNDSDNEKKRSRGRHRGGIRHKNFAHANEIEHEPAAPTVETVNSG